MCTSTRFVLPFVQPLLKFRLWLSTRMSPSDRFDLLSRTRLVAQLANRTAACLGVDSGSVCSSLQLRPQQQRQWLRDK